MYWMQKPSIVSFAYNATCTLCNAIIHHSSWYPNGSEKMGIFFYPDQSPYIMATNQTVFEVKLLDQVTHQIVHGGVIFESRALVYNLSFGSYNQRRLASLEDVFSWAKVDSSFSWKLNEKRLEDSWFLYQIILYHKSQSCLATHI